jgi:hypothetical protein
MEKISSFGEKQQAELYTAPVQELTWPGCGNALWVMGNA